MSLPPGCRFRVAPHFHLAADWSRRLLIGSGDSWRPPTSEEIAVLVDSTPAEPDHFLSLFNLPGHLGLEWWGLLEQGAEALSEGRLPGFEPFFGRVVEFLTFKGLAVPGEALGDVAVSRPGADWPTPSAGGPRLWGVVNLGDEPLSIVFTAANVRLILGPGEGCSLPRIELALSGHGADREEPDILLRLWQRSPG